MNKMTDARVMQDIKRWYRWKTNTARLARSCGSNGVLNMEVTLSGGDELKGTRAPQEVEVYSQCHYDARVKVAADSAIMAEGASSRGEKLSKRKEVTRMKYAAEEDTIKAEVKQKHKEALAHWKYSRELAKAGFVEEVDNDAKIQYVMTLGVLSSF
jgi:hypothetical protein